MNYYVSVSSFDKKQEANILIRVPGDEKEVKGSLRFNYMVPVPDQCIEKLVIKDIKDDKYRLLLNKEYRFCINNSEKIQKKANKIYEMVTTNRKQILTDNSCAFYLLDEYSDGGNRPNRQLVPTNPGKCSNGSGIGTVNYFP